MGNKSTNKRITKVELGVKGTNLNDVFATDYFFPMVRLLILSSSNEHTSFGSFLTSVILLIAPISFRVTFWSSTSTTFTTALPSRTLLTLSADNEVLPGEDPPEKASQNALPRRFNKV